MNKLIELKSVSVDYDNYRALDSVSLTIYSDDFIGIIGPNGGGKTTLIKTILGGVEYSGEIEFYGEFESNKNKFIGYLPQINNFDKTFPISVKEVVLSGMMSRKSIFAKYSKEDKNRAIELLTMVGVGALANKAVGELSGGELQRVLLCRALISDPKLLILDEPANFVDNKFEKELYAILRTLNEKIAIIMVSHDVVMTTSVVKNIVCVNKKVHRHRSNVISNEQLKRYNCPIQSISSEGVPHMTMGKY